jgi:hypothetical protein
MVWTRIAYSPMNEAYFSYRDDNDTLHYSALSSLNRSISIDQVHNPKTTTVTYLGDNFALKEIIEFANSTYQSTVKWQVSALSSSLNYASLYLSEYLNPSLAFTKANIPGVLDWANPKSNATKVDAGQWSIASFSSQNFKDDKCIDVLDESNKAAFALKFVDLPSSGNVGSLAVGNIDAVRWQYNFYRVKANYTVTVVYQTLSFSMTSLPQLKNAQEMNTLFDSKPKEQFEVQARNFASIIRDNCVSFIVYDSTRFDKKILISGWLQLVYSNDKYVILKVKDIHPFPNVFEN